MKKYLILLGLVGVTACGAPNPHPPVKSTMDPANAEATTAAFIATRLAKTALPTVSTEAGTFVMLVCTACTAQTQEVSIWEFAGSNTAEALIVVPDQTVVEILDSILAEDGSIWYQVRFNGIVGWVDGDFIKDIDV